MIPVEVPSHHLQVFGSEPVRVLTPVLTVADDRDSAVRAPGSHLVLDGVSRHPPGVRSILSTRSRNAARCILPAVVIGNSVTSTTSRGVLKPEIFPLRESAQIHRRDAASGARNHARDDDLAESMVWNADHADVGDVRMSSKECLDLERVHAAVTTDLSVHSHLNRVSKIAVI